MILKKVYYKIKFIFPVFFLLNGYARFCYAKGSRDSTKQVVFRYSAEIAMKKKANPFQFFDLGLIDEDISVDKIAVKISPNIAYSFATVRLSMFPVEKFGDQEQAGWYFTGNPPKNMGTLGSWQPNSKKMNSLKENGQYFLKKGTHLIFEILFNESSLSNSGGVWLALFKNTNQNNTKQFKPKRYFNRFEINEITIPPLAEFLELSTEYILTEDIKIMALKPTMHLRGVSVTMGYTRTEKEGPQILVEIPRYSIFNYKAFGLKKPVSLKKGSKLWIKGIYNNSFSNFLNPNPLTTVYRGWKINDEMLRFSYQYYKE